jgi:pyridoxine 4-dehydrogenase
VPEVASTLALGDTEVTRVGLGTNRLSRTPHHVAFIRDAVEAGLQLIDTAHTYMGGQSEATVGEALSPAPDGCTVATKGGYNSASPDILREEIEGSLRRLRRDSIGLYYLHRPDPHIPLEESLALIKEYWDRGKIGLVGVSQVTIEQIERARGVVPIAAVQNHYNLSRRSHDDVVDYCAREGIPFVPYFPLRGSGGSALAGIAERHGVTQQQIALAWLLRRSPTMLPIPGTLSLEHLKANLAAVEIELTDDEFEALS